MGLDPSKFHSTYTSATLPSLEISSSSAKAPYIFSEPHLPPQQTTLSKPSSHLWPTNYSKLSTATMFTMFFAGEIFAPKATILVPGRGENNVGQLMQGAYINAFRYFARKLASLECILGWDVMNEPHPGFIGLPSLKQWNEDTELHLGVMANGVQGMVLASGGEGAPNIKPHLSIPIYHRSWPRPSKVSGYVDYELSRSSRVWLDGRKDIWREEGVWWWDQRNGEGYDCKWDYFTRHPKTGALVDFERDFYEPFIRKFLSAVREGRSEGLKDLGLHQGAGMGLWSFIEPVPNIGPPTWVEEEELVEADKTTIAGGLGVCYAPHWYDLRACFEKRLSYSLSFDVGALALGSRNFFKHSYFGRLGLLGNYKSQLTRVVSRVQSFRQSGKPTPTLVGETGAPFDINGFEAYKTGDVHWQMVMLDSITGAMERVGKGSLSWTLWNFTSENFATVDPISGALESGDGWNSEDFSLVSRDQAMTEVDYPQQPLTLSGCRPRTKTLAPNNKGVPLTRARDFGDLYAGARCIGAWVRPYPAKVAGILLSSQFTLGNVDSGTRACWGGTFKMKYLLGCGNKGSSDLEIARTTEIFLPAYHFGGEPWSLVISILKFPGSRAEITVTSGECSGVMDIQSTHGTLSWIYSEVTQSLNIVHTHQLSGWAIEVVATSRVSAYRRRHIVLRQVLTLFTLGVLGFLIALVMGSWYYN